MNGRDVRGIALGLLAAWVCATAAPAEAANETIMPLGDSVTQANGSHDSYRRPLWFKLLDAGYEVDFVGSLDKNHPNAVPPNPDFDMDHEGHWGWRADELLAGLPGWLSGYDADIVLLHAGSNDALQVQSTASTVNELSSIIDALRADNPDVTILLAQLIPTTRPENVYITELNAAMPAIVADKHTAQSPVILVDQNTGFDAATETYDGLHPNFQGEEKMAQKWLDTLATVLPEPVDDTPPSVATVFAGPTDTEVTVVFSEPVESASAEDIANYQFDQGITVTDAQLGGDQQTVSLTVWPLVEDLVYSLAVTGVLDLADPPNAADDVVNVVYSPSERVTAGQLLLYAFQAGAGSTVFDLSSVGSPMDLTIDNPANVSWIPGGGLSVADPALIWTATDTKLASACSASNEITIEAWIQPDSATQTGPARIVTFSTSSSLRNFTLGAQNSAFDARLRTTATNLNGLNPNLTTENGVVDTSLIHVVYTRDSSGVAKIYKDGVEIDSGTIPGDLSNWNPGYGFALANELNDPRPWLGDYYLVAVYERALSNVEVQTNFDAGFGWCASVPAAPSGIPDVSVATSGDDVLLSWAAVAEAAWYEIVRGELGLLGSSGGDYITATDTCVSDNETATSTVAPGTPVPVPGDGYWYLVRAVNCKGKGTYDSGGVHQVGLRGPEIESSLNDCP